MAKYKLRNFFLRFFPVISSLLLIVLCAAPASAAGGTWGVPFAFDSIGLSGTASSSIIGNAPFPLSRTGPTSTVIGGIDIESGFNNIEDGMIDIDWSFSSGTYVMELRADQLVIPSSVLFDDSGFLIFQFYFSSGSSDVSALISYGLGRVSDGSTYQLHYQGDSFSVGSAAGVDLASAIGDRILVAGNSISDLGDYVLLYDFYIKFTSDSPIVRFNMRQNNQTDRYNFGDWFDSQELVSKTVVVDSSDPSGVNLVDWLQVAVGGFLDFELWPGMSLNELLWVCLVIGILFTFFEMIV